MVGKSSETITAEALVERAAPLYLGFETKLSSPEAACSMPLRPVISVSGEPFSRRAFRAEAMAESFIGNGKMTHRSYTRRRLRQMVGSAERHARVIIERLRSRRRPALGWPPPNNTFNVLHDEGKSAFQLGLRSF